MKRRIFVYHTLTVLAALVALLAVSGSVMHWITSRYLEWSRSAMDTRTVQVQERLSDYTADGNWKALDAELAELRYSLYVLENGREIYSSLNPFQEESYRRLYGDKSWPSRDALTVQNEGMIMIGTRSDAYTIVAVSQPDVPKIFGHQRPQGEAFMLTLLASGFAAIVIIVLLSLIFTNYQIK